MFNLRLLKALWIYELDWFLVVKDRVASIWCDLFSINISFIYYCSVCWFMSFYLFFKIIFAIGTGTVWLGMIIFLQCDLGQFHDLLLHVMRGTTEGPWVQGKTVGVPMMRGIMHQTGHWVRGVMIAVLWDLGQDPTGRSIFQFVLMTDFSMRWHCNTC